MTRTGALLDHVVAADMTSRRMLEHSSSNPTADESNEFPELLGRLVAHQTPDQRGNAQPETLNDGRTRGPSPSQLPWKFRLGDELALLDSADVTRAASADPRADMATEQATPDLDQMPVSVLDIASELLADQQVRDDGKLEEAPDIELAAGPAPADQKVEEPAPLLVDANAVLGGAGVIVVVENSVRAAAAPSNAQALAGTKARRAEAPVDAASPTRPKASLDDPAAAIPVDDDGSKRATLPMPTMKFSDGAATRGRAEDQAASSQVTGETKVTVLRTETHLPVTGHTLPMQQIAERLAAELGAVETSNTTFDTASLSSASVKPQSAVKVLHIQLQPAELGTVTVRMVLTRDALEVQLDVSRQETAQLLQQDREVLSKVLQSTGYVLDGLTVHVVDADRASAPMQVGPQGNHGMTQPSVQSQPGWSQPDGQPSGMPQRQAEHGARRAPEQSDAAARAINDGIGPRAPSGGVYL